jgi:hypothetical protein
MGGAYTRFGWGNIMESDHLEDLGIHGRAIITVKCIFKKQDGECGLR